MPYEVQHQIEIPEDTLFRAALVSIEVRHVVPKDTRKEPFDMLKWKFVITQDGEFKDKEVYGECSAWLSDHPDNIFRNWAEALLQRPLDLGLVLDEQELVGLSALVTVRYEPDRNDPRKKWRRVDQVISLSGNYAGSDSGYAGSDEPPF